MNEFTRDFVAQTFTPQEQLYLRFAAISIKKQMRKGISPVSVRTDEVATVRFLNFLEKFYQEHKIEDSNYRVQDTFSRIYTVIKSELSRVVGDKVLKQSDPTKTALTEKQALIICHYAKEVWISLSPESFDVYLHSMGNHNTYYYMTYEISLDLVGIANRSINLYRLDQRINESKKNENLCKCSQCNKKLNPLGARFLSRIEALDPEIVKLKINPLDK